MKFITKLLASPLVKGAGRFLDSAVLGGAVKNFKDEATDSPKGSIDYPALIGSLAIPILLIVLYATGVITMVEVEQLNELGK